MKRVRLHRPDYEFTARHGQMEAEVSPPSCAQIHTHTFGNPFFMGQLPYDLCQPTYTHTHTHVHGHTQTHLANYQHTKGMIRVTLEPLTQPVMVWTYTLCSPSSSIKYGKHLCFWRAQQPSVAVEHRQQADYQIVYFLQIWFDLIWFCCILWNSSNEEMPMMSHTLCSYLLGLLLL